MKAPDKITISKYNIADDGDVVFAWVDNSPDCEPMNHPVEYVRIDTFVEKACKFIETYPHLFMGVLRSEVINDFKNYMKGE